MALSTQQIAVMNWIVAGKGNLILRARAGCGKTYTLLEMVRVIISRSETVFLGAYNTAISLEIAGKLKNMGAQFPQVVSSTMHSAGNSAWRYANPKVVLDENKVAKILTGIRDECERLALSGHAKAAELNMKKDLCDQAGTFVKRAVSLAKQRAFGFLCSYQDPQQWFDMIEHFGLEQEMEEEVDLDTVIKLCIKVYEKSLAQNKEVIDYDDMILAPLVNKARMFQYDWVMIDEAQDTNPARRALAAKMLKPGGRFVAVGDNFQAIYGFCGADNNSLDLIQKAFTASELPLTMTYRCPKVVAAIAQQWVPDIEAHESNGEGVYRTLNLLPTKNDDGENVPSFQDELLTNEDVILCRNNKPLVELAYNLIRRGIACKVEGREIGTGLAKLARRWKVKKLDALKNRLESWQKNETQKVMAKNREDLAAAIEDKYETLMVMIDKLQEEGKTTVEELVTFIFSLFGDTKEGEVQKVLTLSSIHKSKGREWKRVYILGRNKYMPSKWAVKEWQQQQERNLMYVAVTRSMNELVDIVVN
jgi:superfamily I DNA/RNA helicase